MHFGKRALKTEYKKSPFNCIIITVLKGDVCKHVKLMLNVSGNCFSSQAEFVN